MSGVAAVESDSEDKFMKATLAEASSPAPTEPQKPMDADKAAIYRYIHTLLVWALNTFLFS